MRVVLLVTKPCVHCGQTGLVEVSEKALRNYMNGMSASRAFTELDFDLREQVITGTHPECWDQMFGEIDCG